MKDLIIAGGLYHEKCAWPRWDHLYGSGGRAAAAVSANITNVLLKTYARQDVARDFSATAEAFGFDLDIVDTQQVITFDYFHPLSEPNLIPRFSTLRLHEPFSTEGKAVLRFGMLEGSAIVNSDRCVYDPQCPLDPQRFELNGSRSDHLTIVANSKEVVS